MGENEFELDVSKLVRAEANTVAVRIWNDAEIGGMFNRSFFWSPPKP